SEYVADLKTDLVGFGAVGSGESLTVQVYNGTTLVKTFRSNSASTDGGMTLNSTNGSWRVSDANWGSTSLQGGRTYTVKAFTTVADGSGGQIADDVEFSVIAPIIRSPVDSETSDTASQVYALDDGGYMMFYVTGKTSTN